MDTVKRLFVAILFCAVLFFPGSTPVEQRVSIDQSAQALRSSDQPAALFTRITKIPTAREEIALADAPFMKLMKGASEAELIDAKLHRDDFTLLQYSIHQMVPSKEVFFFRDQPQFSRFSFTINEGFILDPGRAIILPKFDQETLGDFLFVNRDILQDGIRRGVREFEYRTGLACGIRDYGALKHKSSIPLFFSEQIDLSSTASMRVGQTESIGGLMRINAASAHYDAERNLNFITLDDVHIELTLRDLRSQLAVLQLLQASPEAVHLFMATRIAKLVCHEMIHAIGVFHSRRIDDVMYPVALNPTLWRGTVRQQPVRVGSRVTIPLPQSSETFEYTIPPGAVWVVWPDNSIEIMELFDGDIDDDPTNVVARALALLTRKLAVLSTEGSPSP